MNTKTTLWSLMLLLVLGACKSGNEEPVAAQEEEEAHVPFDWRGANVYFLLTDRFNNADPSNDVNFGRTNESAVLRGFEGGDIKGVTQKIQEGYFDQLGIQAIWMTPIVEQVHDGTDEGTGYTYAYHGYWTKDWTALDPNFGTAEDLAELVKTAHEHGIRILLDAVINHTGPVTDIDTVWPEDWVRTEPKCTYESYDTTIKCTLVENLPDILTESNEDVELPPQLVEKWKAEGRYDHEVAELDAFFQKTGYPRAPRFYIMKWLSDYITDYGIDGYRVDTVRHTEEYVWEEFEDVCEWAYADWKAAHPDDVLDDTPFYLVGEIYGYSVTEGQFSDFGDKKVNYFNDSFSALINFDLRSSADRTYEEVFSTYSGLLQNELAGFGTLSYMTSHDDSNAFDLPREKTYEAANRLLLAPGASQVYYGDELGRSLIIEGTEGDATLRSFMNWEDMGKPETEALLRHYRKLGQFRRDHPAVGAGVHRRIAEEPYIFSRIYQSPDWNETVLVALDAPEGTKTLEVGTAFVDGTELVDSYSEQTVTVTDGKVQLDSPYTVVLLAEK